MTGTPAGERCPDFTVREPKTETELREKAALERQALREIYAGFPATPPDAFVCRTSGVAGCTLAAVSGGRLLGYACCRLCPDRDLVAAGEIAALYVLPDCRRRGVGRALLQASLDRLGMYPRIAVWVPDDAHGAAAFFSRFGFEFDGKKDMKWVGRICDESRMLLNRTANSERRS